MHVAESRLRKSPSRKTSRSACDLESGMRFFVGQELLLVVTAERIRTIVRADGLRSQAGFVGLVPEILHNRARSESALIARLF